MKGNTFDPVEPPPGQQADRDRGDQSRRDAVRIRSKPLRVEKVVAAGGKITVQVRRAAAGRYRFFDDYHEATTEGFLVVK